MKETKRSKSLEFQKKILKKEAPEENTQEIPKPKQLQRSDSEQELSTKNFLLSKVIKRNQSSLKVRNFFTIKSMSEANRTTDDTRMLNGLESKVYNLEQKVQKLRENDLFEMANHSIRVGGAKLKQEEKVLNRSYSEKVRKFPSKSTASMENPSFGFRRENSMGNKTNESTLAKSTVGMHHLPHHQRILMKISKNLMSAAKLQEEKRVGLLTTNMSEIEHSRHPSTSYMAPPSFTGLVTSVMHE